MAPGRPEEIAIRRIVACFAPGAAGAPEAIAELAQDIRAELLGLFIEDAGLLRFAGLPFAVEVGFPSAARRRVDRAGLERQMQAQAAALQRLLARALQPDIAWSFRVARASPMEAVAAALGEARAPTLLIPPRGHPRAERRVVRQADLGMDSLRRLIEASRPVLVLPEEPACPAA